MDVTPDAVTDTQPVVRSRTAYIAPFATVFISSACIMVIELVAGRVVSRFIGQSLYTWTSIIGVVLAGISLGNYLGGKIADRWWGRATLGVQFILAALGCVAILPLNNAIGQALAPAPMAWPIRIALHVTGVFMLPAALLGTISPVIAKRALELPRTTGRTMGDVYAYAIAGSIVGTILTGFYLPVLLGATAILVSAACMLGLVGILYCVAAALRPEPAAASHTRESASSVAWPLRERLNVIGTVFLASAIVMAMEVAAGRMASRQFGQSLFTWTTVIGLVLFGMTVGSYIGGRLADRVRGHALLTFLLIASALACVAALPVHMLMADTTAFVGYSWPMQILIYVAALFLLPSIVLGAIPPAAAKIAIQQTNAPGRTVGVVYAWGSIGSIVGTFLAGYLLIAAWGTHVLLLALALALILIAIPHARRTATGTESRRPWLTYAWALAALIVLIIATLPAAPVRTLAQRIGLREPTPANAVYTDESQYSFIYVTEAPDQPGVREMFLDQLVHSQVTLGQPLDLKYEYEWVYEAVLNTVYPMHEPVTAMVIGGGGYAFPHYLEAARPGSYVEVSEIDPAVTEAAFAAFGLPRDTTIAIYNMDARNRVDDLMRRKRAGEDVPEFDCIFGDSINDYTVPYHLTTHEFVQDIHTLLSDSGIYLLNMIDMFDSGRFLGAVVATCRSVFPHVYVFNTGRPEDVRDTFIVVSSKQPLNLTKAADQIRTKYNYLGDLLPTEALDALIARTGSVMLTDDYAPVENFLAPVVRTRGGDPLQVAYDRAMDLAAEGNVDDAITELRMIIEREPGWVEANGALGNLLLQTKQHDAALAHWQTVVEAYPNRPEPHYQLGRVYLAMGARDDAIASFEHALEREPNHANALERLGAVYLQTRDVTAAIDVLKRAVAADPNHVTAYYNLGLAYASLNQLPDAIDAWRKAIALDPQHNDSHYNLVLALTATQAYDDAWAEVRAWRDNGGQVDQALLDQLRQASGRNE